MQIPFHTLAQDSVLQIRDAMRRVKRLHDGGLQQPLSPMLFGGLVELPQPEARVWEDTEIDVRRVVL